MYSINSISEIVTVEQLDLIIEFKRPVLLEKVDVLISVDYFILPNLTCNLDTQTPVIILRALSFVSLKHMYLDLLLVHIDPAVPVCFVIFPSLMDQYKNLWQLSLNVTSTFKENENKTESC